MSEMVARVARAICIAEGNTLDADDPYWQAYEPAARAAIEAMREPAPMVLLNAGAILGWPAGGGERLQSEWQAMIDASLMG